MNSEKLSKAVSHALRHEPWLYELELDDEGWVAVADLLSALRTEAPEWALLNEVDLAEMISHSDKKRHELLDGKIRAFYGHSLPNKLLKQAAQPPAILYHGTSPDAALRIKADGLLPMGRQYVHLSADKVTAERVGRRRTQLPVLFQINAARANTEGIVFYQGSDLVWLSDYVPATFVNVLEMG